MMKRWRWFRSLPRFVQALYLSFAGMICVSAFGVAVHVSRAPWVSLGTMLSTVGLVAVANRLSNLVARPDLRALANELATTFTVGALGFGLVIALAAVNEGLITLLVGPAVGAGFCMLVMLRFLILDIAVPSTKRRVLLERHVAGALPAGIVHLSDLHLSATDTIEGARPGAETQACISRALQEAAQGEYVCVTGDLTDRGALEEYQCIRRLIGECSTRNVFPIPGNHDMTLFGEPHLARRVRHSQYELRARRWAWLYRELASDSWRCVGADGAFGRVKDELEMLEPFLRFGGLEDSCIRPAGSGVIAYPTASRGLTWVLAELIEKAGFSRYWFGSQMITAVFPVLFHCSDTVAIIGLDSCRMIPRGVAGNAFGSIGSVQLDRLRTLLKLIPQTAHRVVLCHHHVGVPRDLADEFKKRLKEEPFMRLVDASSLLGVLDSGEATTILHGHKHYAYQARWRSVRIISAPSVLYGNVGAVSTAASFGGT